jgi:hypothetical protein
MDAAVGPVWETVSLMEYVILIIVIAVLALGTGGWLLFVRPRRGRISAPSKPSSPAVTPSAPPAVSSAPADEQAAEAGKPQATAGVLDLERPPPSAGRLVRLRARLARSQSSVGSALLACCPGTGSTTRPGTRSKRCSSPPTWAWCPPG